MTNETDISPYQSAYQTLKKNAELLEHSEQIDIDDLTNIVEESIAAYKVCQARILAVETALKQSFDKLSEE